MRSPSGRSEPPSRGSYEASRSVSRSKIPRMRFIDMLVVEVSFLRVRRSSGVLRVIRSGCLQGRLGMGYWEVRQTAMFQTTSESIMNKAQVTSRCTI